MAVKRGTRRAAGPVSVVPILQAIAAGRVDATSAWRAWDRRDRDPIPSSIYRDGVAKERPERTAPETFSAPVLQIWSERFARFVDRLPNLADDKDRQALRNLGYTGGWS